MDTQTPNQNSNGAQSQNKIEHHAIALPKGGGAIRGIGEKFQANAVTGTGSFTVPLPISPGRSGFAPQLALSYDSGAGNSEFGLGWNVGVPSITRKTDKMLPQYLDGEESDTFLLSGAEDLVPLLEEQDGEWQRVEKQIAETEHGTEVHYSVYPYRPRIEGLFARIERWVDAATGDTHWRATTKENITSLYGRRADARIGDPTDPSKVFQWLLERSFDAKGNVIRYQYKAENRDNIPWSASEKHRLAGPQPFTNLYLKCVQYSPFVDDPDRFHFQLLFDYGEHSHNTPDEDATWPVRQDPLSRYKAGFEIRTYRLCQRVLMFHNFPTDAADDWQLVKSTELTHDQSPVVSYLTTIVQRGYQRNPSGYETKALPPLEFEYTRPQIDDQIRRVDAESLENLPAGLDNANYQWVDLEGEGLSGILAHQGDALYYKANQGSGTFGPARVVRSLPQPLSMEGPLQITDINGDGNNELVLKGNGLSGFFEYKEGQWQNFVPFQQNLTINWSDPNLKLIGLNGDGYADILITEHHLFRWHPSRAHAGFDQSRTVPVPADENQGPSLVFADQTQSIYLADMTGDGLTDIVRIRNGELCYWPNLGHGRFGAKVNVHNAPHFDSPEKFNQQYVKLGDIDGSGTTDIFYFGNGKTRYWLNQAGNSFSEMQALRVFPPVDSLSSVSLVDFTGKGTLSLVWSTRRPGEQAQQLSYVDLMVEKPHLMCEIDNNLGKLTCLTYAPSTQFYLADKRAGKPWITKLPFPVHVLKQVETIDQISGSRLVSSYDYHHGYFDGKEREFRGFGLVETIDTETFEVYASAGYDLRLMSVAGTDDLENEGHRLVIVALVGSDLHIRIFDDSGEKVVDKAESELVDEEKLTTLKQRLTPFPEESSLTRQDKQEIICNATFITGHTPCDPQHYVAPVLTKTWFHNGAYVKENEISTQYVTEYYAGDSQAFLLPDTVIEQIETLSPEVLPEAYRALKGSALRQEIYEEGKETPYQVTESNFRVKQLQPKEADTHHAVFFVHPNETITYHYEQNNADPRIAHDFTLEVDAYGNVTKTCQLVYPRREAAPDARSEQQQAHATVTVNAFINETERFYLLGVPAETKTFEIGIPTKNKTDDALTIKSSEQVTREQAAQLVDEALNEVIPYAADFSGATLQARLFSWTRNLFWNLSQDAPLPIGKITAKALMHHTEAATFTPELIKKTYGEAVTAETLQAAGYVLQEDYWWNPGLIQHYIQGSFYLPHKTEDPFGGVVRVSYDRFYLAPVETIDALGNTSRAEIDYRTLSPWRLTDPNGNHSEAITNPMGMVIATSVYGAEAGKEKGDIPIFAKDGSPNYQVQPDPSMVDILANPQQYLQGATTFFFYDLEAWRTRQEPPQSVLIARETHVSELAAGEVTQYQKTIAYSDGFGRELQSKLLVEPGKAWVKQPDGGFEEETVNERWLVSGRTVYNNKEKPVKQYEPFYSATHRYEAEAFFANYGVTPVIHYDPLLRVVRTDTPKGFFSKVEFTPWEIRTYDENDTVKDSDYYKKNNLPTEERAALTKAEAHYNTPQISLLDSLGREFISIENKLDIAQLTEENRQENELITSTEFNIAGKPIEIIDPRQHAQGNKIKTFVYTYDMQQTVIRTLSMDAGDDRVVNNVLGNPVFSADARGHQIRIDYDRLQRPVKTSVKGNGLDNTVERLIYGEDEPNAEAKNLRGQLYRHYDQAGCVETPRYSFKGEPLEAERRVRTEYRAEADWREGEDWDALLEAERFVTETRYDALGRVRLQKNPDGSETKPAFHQSGKLDKVNVRLKGEASDTAFVSSISYNAKGQREKIVYGNQTETLYTYEPTTFRLTSLITRRTTDGKVLQDIRNIRNSDDPGYTYDPVGNITRIEDRSHARVFHNNQVVEPVCTYTYDALYRITEATGREHVGLNVPDYYKHPDSFKQSAFIHLENPNDAQKLANYTRQYAYDNAGNLFQIRHIAADSARSFTREIVVDETTNRAVPKSMGENPDFGEFFDPNGNLTALEHLTEIQWNYRDNIASATVIKREGATDDAEYYVYDAAGNRVRKVKETLKGGGQVEIEEKIYLGDVEIKHIRTVGSNATSLERSSLHVMDDQSRTAIVHHWAQDNLQREVASSSDIVENKIRYQYGNHFDSVSLETDDTGQVISYEEYFPYGGTNFVAGNSQTEVNLKEYRHSGKERDDTTGLFYYGARYYAPWLGRWMSCDPLTTEETPWEERSDQTNAADEDAGSEESGTTNKHNDESMDEVREDQTMLFQSDGTNLYVYVSNNPLVLFDPDGRAPQVVGRIYVIEGTLGGKSAVYVGSTAQELRKRFSAHTWKKLIQAKNTKVTVYEVGADIQPSMTRTKTVRAAVNQALRAVEQKVLTKVRKGKAARILNRARAGLPKNVKRWIKTHSPKLHKPSVAKLRGGTLKAAGGVLILLDILKMARQIKANKYSQGPAVLAGEGGEFTVDYELGPLSGLWGNKYYENYISGPLSGKRLEISKEKFEEHRKEARALYGYIDWKGDFVPGLIQPKPTVTHLPPVI